MATAARAHVVVVGCGFGGLEATRALVRSDFDVTLIDRSNHHLFQPLLYQVATAGLSAPSISGAIRHVLRREMRSGRLTVLMGEVTAVDAASRCVVIDGRERLGYEHLILATGATHSYFGHDDWAAHAPGLKTLADAFEIRRRVLLAFERAERNAVQAGDVDPAELTFAVVGAGPTGVEMAGVLAEIARHTLRGEYRRIDPRSARVVLLEGAPRVLASFAEHLSMRAQTQLAALGVEVLTGAQVTAIDDTGLSYRRADDNSDGEHRLPAHTVVWAAGVAASPTRSPARAGHRLRARPRRPGAGRARPEPARPLRDQRDRRPGRRAQPRRAWHVGAGARRQPGRQADGALCRRQPPPPRAGPAHPALSLHRLRFAGHHRPQFGGGDDRVAGIR